ncbi:protein phosphatase 2C domain-containing protein [Actinophytocola gossypii]|uniref:Protein phosphatase 2C domain-containing protein n=1 Tax=Actinophytocola gossypii TaxID=2812003 RepID=A0ABT2J479_9PSEU|nr:protein phosphatase 2C domain-containing protein [Actinophytocola gossypii]MCT2582394.1 protein phosphatase 2C domain-containing protein [Actinophytocola gossypii]
MTVDTTWGDRGVFRPREVGPRAAAAEAPWRLGPFADVPDTVLDAGRVGALEVRAASTRGFAHRCDGDVRQDAVGLSAPAGRVVLAAVADGVGAATDAHHGARLAVRHALGYLAWAMPDGPLDGLLDAVDVAAAVHAADRAVGRAGPAPRHRSTTLTVAAVDVSPGAGGHAFRVARVGDSPAFVLAHGRFRALFDDVEGELHDPATDSLPAPAGPVERVAGVLAPGEALVLASDGVGVPLRETEAGAYLADAWAEPPGPVAFLHQLQFNVRSYDDDRTAAVIWAGSESA